jgi:predicted transcriptional regulator
VSGGRCDVGTAGTLVMREVLLQQRPTIPSIALALGRTKSTVHNSLFRLRQLGLVAWEDGRQGTIRSLVHLVPFGVEQR